MQMQGPAFLILSMIFLSLGTSAAKMQFSIFGAEGATAVRLFYSSLILCAVFKPWKIRINPLQAKAVIKYGLSLGMMNLLFYKSLEKLPFGIAVAIEFIGPLSLALLNSHKRIDFIWLLVAVLGLYILLPIQPSLDSISRDGGFYALVAGFFWALYIIYGQQTAGISPQHASTLGVLIATIVITPYCVYIRGFDVVFNLPTLPMALVIALFSNTLPYLLEMLALRELSKKAFSILVSLEPSICAISGFLILGDQISLFRWVGVVLIFIASLGVTLTDRK